MTVHSIPLTFGLPVVEHEPRLSEGLLQSVQLSSVFRLRAKEEAKNFVSFEGAVDLPLHVLQPLNAILGWKE